MGATNDLLPMPEMGKYINSQCLGPFQKEALLVKEYETTKLHVDSQLLVQIQEEAILILFRPVAFVVFIAEVIILLIDIRGRIAVPGPAWTGLNRTIQIHADDLYEGL